jgi:predicted cation transporter
MVASIWKWDFWFMLAHIGWKSLLVVVTNSLVATLIFWRELLKVQVPHSEQKRISLRSGLIQIIKLKDARLKDAAGVGLFLAGLVVLGGVQNWWLKPMLTGVGNFSLYLGTIGLTTVIDNAALTYLAGQVPDLPEATKYLLVTGAVAGGGMTILANAPNPAGIAILGPAFADSRVSPISLAVFALFPTSVAAVCFWVL